MATLSMEKRFAWTSGIDLANRQSILVMLFIKYGNYDGFEPPVIIPNGASFKDMIALKGNSDIGSLINKPLIDANSRLARGDFPDVNDSNKLGDGAQKTEQLLFVWVSGLFGASTK